MPRLPRLHVPGGCYHVVLRGNHREDLFATVDDRYELNGVVALAAEKYGARFHAYCWMTNHLHALVQIGDVPLGKLMHAIARRYSRYRHKALHTTGHLFERRYKAWLVDTDEYFIALLRYIHRNPIRAGMVRSVDDYRWSSHRSYLGQESYSWLCTEFGLSMFGETLEGARRTYRLFMNEGDYASEERIHDESHPDDPRVLGGDRFLASLPPPRVKPRSRLTLDQLIAEVCERHSVSVEAVKSPAKHPQLANARATIAARAVDERIASMAEVARRLERSHPALSQLLARRRSR